jgi:succinate dehydrogenase / fumarate reductase iron-sulfur subunit
MAKVTFSIWRTNDAGGQFQNYEAEISEGMVVLDAVHQIQAEQANDLAVRWNCKAGKCGSCSAEINGHPKLMCMTRLDDMPRDKPIKKKIKKFKPRQPDAPDGTWRMYQGDIDRVQEFRKCIECFLCQDVCHVIREHHLHEEFAGPRHMVYTAALEMHPLDVEDRRKDLKDEGGIGLCNITKCCTNVCPENITITDNAIIPLKERVADRFYDPLMKLLSIFGKK